MSLNPDIRDQAYQFFVEEAQELLQVLETGLLDLRQDHSTPKVHELMRAAHSIKGGAASVELSAIGLLAHRLEDFFKALYSDEVDIDAELENLLLRGYDCLSQPLLEQIEAGAFDEEAALLNAEPVFAALEERLAEALENADNYIPSSNDLGVDIVSSIFEVDVVQALDRLEAVIQNPSDYDPAAELEQTLEMFAGFAELFNLPGFTDIVQTARSALQSHPDRTIDIIRATVADCTEATEQVLAGDRQQGGTVSQALLDLAQGNVTEDSTDSAIANGGIWSDTAIDADNLWSSATTEEVDDVFGTMMSSVPRLAKAGLADDRLPQPEDTSQINFAELPADNDNLWSDVPEESATNFDTIASEETTNGNDAADEDISSLFDMLGDEPAEINNELLSFAELPTDSDNLWSDVPEEHTEVVTTNDTEPAAEDISPFFDMLEDSDTAIADDDLFVELPPDSDNLWSNVPNEPAPENVAPVDNSDTTTDAPAEITAAVESVTDVFDSLPPAEAKSFSPPAKSKSPQNKPTTAPQAQSGTGKLSVRVDLDRLERMNNLVGELTINRNTLDLQNEQLQENVSELEQKFWRFRNVAKQLQEISDRMVLEARSRNVLPTEPSDIEAEFDALEMDSYSQLYSSLQVVLEEMVQLEESVEDITIFAQQSDRTINNQRQMLGQMRNELMWVRMLPLERILQRFPRTLRDLSRKYDKLVDLKLKGTGVLVDKAVLEKLSDPLLHLLRNGFDHGIEESEVRTQKGKSPTGSIEIQAYYQGNQTVIEVKDDGKGLDLERIAQKGIERGLISPQEAATAPKERLFELIFEPGFSTASKVSEISGRGVGMNIVRSQIETLKGKISVTSTVDRGSTFTLRLPLTLTIAKLLVCSLGSTAFAIPSDSIEEIVIPDRSQIKFANGQKFLSQGDRLIPVYVLRELLGYNCPISDLDSNSQAFKTIAPPKDWLAPLLLLRRGQQIHALEVVSLLNEQELVIKPYGKAIAAPKYSYGCTILGDGSLIPAFDGSTLIGTILGEPQKTIHTTPEAQTTNTENKPTALKTIMVVDDSTALRRTMALTLEKQGYRVIQKKDGKEALDGFKQHPELDLIICDVEMPVMNGFEFLSMRRRDSALAQVPTFMLTSRSGAKHRNLAKQLGADGYFTKPYVEQDFVREVKNILQGDREKSTVSKNPITTKTKTILIIDDSSALRQSLSLTLKQIGYRVLQSCDGAEGLEQLRNNPHTNLVICDIEMPNVNGFEFLTLRHQESQLSQIPVVMLASRGSKKYRALAANLGAVGFFLKPYVEEQFVEQIKQYIRA